MLGGDNLPKSRSGFKKIRMTITVGQELFDDLQTRADKVGCSVPSMAVFCANEYIRQDNAMATLKEFGGTVEKLEK